MHLLLSTDFFTTDTARPTELLKGTAAWRAALSTGLVAGFLERLVPDLLDKIPSKDARTTKAKTTDPG